MSGFRWIALIALLGLSTAGCGERDDQPAAKSRPVPVAQPAQKATLQQDGYESIHENAGFTIFWPSGCGRVTEQSSSRPTNRAEQEFILTCKRGGSGYSVRCLEIAHDAHGDPAHPQLVVSLIERQLARMKLRTVRQRPLEADGMQGIEVQAESPDSSKEVWMRGLLIGPNIYLLLAWNDDGGLFEDPESRDFFVSFRVT